MNIPFSQQALIIAMALVVAGCGGSGSSSPKPETPTPETPTPEPETPEPEVPVVKPTPVNGCAVTYEQWKDQLKQDASISQTNKNLNCSGFKQSVFTNSSGQSVDYIWGANLHEPNIVATYQDGKLTNKVYLPQTTSSTKCFTTDKMAKLANGQTLAEVEKILGCKGTHQYSVSSDGSTIEHDYIWESADQKQALNIIFNEDNTIKQFAQSIAPSECTANRSQWDKIRIDDKYEDITTEFGCEGRMIGSQTADTNTYNNRDWGQGDGTTDYTVLSFLNDAVTSKLLMLKDAKSTCVPSFDVWSKLKTGTSYTGVAGVMQCEGVLQKLETQSNSSTYLESVYGWKDFVSKDGSTPINQSHYQISFIGDRLNTKSYINNQQPFSACLPTLQGFDKIELGKDWATIKNTFGCEPTLSSIVENLDNIEKQYSWGEIKDNEVTTYAYVTLDGKDQVVAKYMTFSPKSYVVTDPNIPDPTDPIDPNSPNPTEPNPTEPNLPNSPCAVSYDKWKDLKQYDAMGNVNKQLGCNGHLSSISADDSGTVAEYIWGENLSEPTVRVIAGSGMLYNTIYYPAKSETTSKCFPTEEKREQLKTDQSLEEVEAIIGCKGNYTASYYVEDELTKVYLWEDKTTKESLQITVNAANKLTAINYTELTIKQGSDCLANRNHWDLIKLPQLPYQSAKDIVGCDGIITDEDADNKVVIREWGGKSGTNTDRLILQLFDGYVTAKEFIAKDQVSDHCEVLPTLAQWQAAKLNSSYETIQQSGVCAGITHRIVANSLLAKDLVIEYRWKNKLVEEDRLPVGVYSQQMIFVGSKLKSKSYTDYRQPFSKCTPTRENFDKIKIKGDWDEAKTIFGDDCLPRLTSDTIEEGQTSRTIQYSWGSLKDGEATTYAYVYLDKDNKVIYKSIQFGHQ